MSDNKGVTIQLAGGLGSMIAVTISWSINKSILWCAIHGIFGWFYVLYFHFFVR